MIRTETLVFTNPSKSVEQGKLSPFTDLDPETYAVFLNYLNETNLDNLRKQFQHAPFGQDACLIVVGSDGKKERHAQSKTEVVILDKSNSDESMRHELLEWYADSYGSDTFKNHFDIRLINKPETKHLGTGDWLSYVQTEHVTKNHSIYPDRILNALPIAGNSDIYGEARERVLAEIGSRNRRSSHVRDAMRQQLKRHAHAMRTGTYRDKTIFTQCPPLQIYYEDSDPTEYRFGFKISFLRAVQRKLDILTARLILDGNLSTADASVELPTGTVERLEYFDQFNVSRDTCKVIDAYQWFIQQFHFAQELFKSSHEPIALPFDLNSFEEHRRVIANFVETS